MSSRALKSKIRLSTGDFDSLPPPLLSYTAEIAEETRPLYEKVKSVISPMEWPHFAPLIMAIQALKKERNAILLAHNYQTPEIFHCVGDFLGDSLALAREAAETKADVIVQCGVHFMAETSKILSPHKTVLIPDKKAGCSLAASITGEDVRALRKKYPGVPVVSYVNTSAEVKAESDICCTSSNAVQVVESLGAPRVLCIPDEYLAKNIAQQTDVEILSWKGLCEVHELFTAEEMRGYREAHSDLQIIAHSRMCAGCCRGGGFFRLHLGDDSLGSREAAAQGDDGDGMLHVGQCGCGKSECGVHTPLQSLPAYEKDYASEDSGFASLYAG